MIVHDPHLTRYPIKQVGPAHYVLKDLGGRQISWHRTKSGALRARYELLEAEELEAEM